MQDNRFFDINANGVISFAKGKQGQEIIHFDFEQKNHFSIRIVICAGEEENKMPAYGPLEWVKTGQTQGFSRKVNQTGPNCTFRDITFLVLDVNDQCPKFLIKEVKDTNKITL